MQEPILKSSVEATAEQILRDLRNSRNHIKSLSDAIAETEYEAAGVMDQLNLAKAQAFVKAATEVSKITGKLINPNLDSQKAASEIMLRDVEGYEAALDAHRDMLKVVQKMKNEIVCEHERRGDLKIRVELLKLLSTEVD